jgi:hypothetical protein
LILKLLNKDPSKRITINNIKTHKWVTKNDSEPLVTNLENRKPITVTEDEVKNSITSMKKLDTLVNHLYLAIYTYNKYDLNFFILKIFIKSMIKKRSFHHPFRSNGSRSSADSNSLDI